MGSKQIRDIETVRIFLDELDEVKNHHRSLVLVMGGWLELLIECLIEKHCKNAKKMLGDDKTYSYAVKLVILNECGVLTDIDFKWLNAFRNIRNDAAHKTRFTLTQERLATLGNDWSVENAFQNCLAIFTTFWNQHADTFAEAFDMIANRPEDSTVTDNQI